MSCSCTRSPYCTCACKDSEKSFYPKEEKGNSRRGRTLKKNFTRHPPPPLLFFSHFSFNPSKEIFCSFNFSRANSSVDPHCENVFRTDGRRRRRRVVRSIVDGSWRDDDDISPGVFSYCQMSFYLCVCFLYFFCPTSTTTTQTNTRSFFSSSSSIFPFLFSSTSYSLQSHSSRVLPNLRLFNSAAVS